MKDSKYYLTFIRRRVKLKIILFIFVFFHRLLSLLKHLNTVLTSINSMSDTGRTLNPVETTSEAILMAASKFSFYPRHTLITK